MPRRMRLDQDYQSVHDRKENGTYTERAKLNLLGEDRSAQWGLMVEDMG